MKFISIQDPDSFSMGSIEFSLWFYASVEVLLIHQLIEISYQLREKESAVPESMPSID